MCLGLAFRVVADIYTSSSLLPSCLILLRHTTKPNLKALTHLHHLQLTDAGLHSSRPFFFRYSTTVGLAKAPLSVVYTAWWQRTPWRRWSG